MHVRMPDERLPPRVEDAQDPNLRPKAPRVGGHLTERQGARLQQPRVQVSAIAIRQRQEAVREREDDVHIWHVEQLALTRVEPALARLRLTLRAVPVAA